MVLTFAFTVPAEASYIKDIDLPVPDKLCESAQWEQVDCIGGAYSFLPTLYEWISWGYDPEDYNDLEPDDAILTRHSEVNTWEMSYADRFCRSMYNLESYNLVSFLSMYNELIPYQSVAYGDKNLKFNYPFDIREYSWEQMNFNEIDWQIQEHWLDIRHYLSDSNYYKITDEDEYWSDDEIWEEVLEYSNNDFNDYFINREFLYKTNIPKTLTLFDNISPTEWTLPASVCDFGLIGRVVPTSGISTYPDDVNFYLVPETRKDYSYSHKDLYGYWNNSPYGMWRYAPYASRWFFADIVNAAAGELNQRRRLKDGEAYPYKEIPEYLLSDKNISIPIKRINDEIEGIGLIYDYCRVMKCARYNERPDLEHSRLILSKYREDIWDEVSESGKKPYKFFSYMAEESKKLKNKIEKKENIKITDSTWYYTIEYTVNANGVEGY